LDQSIFFLFCAWRQPRAMDIDFTDAASLLGLGDARRPSKRPRGLSEGDDEPAEEQPPPPMCPVLEAEVAAEDLVARVAVTAEEAARIEGYEQGSEEWLLSRRGTQTRLKDGTLWSEGKAGPIRFLPGRLTASNFGTAVGHNKYSSPDALVEDMLWGVVVSNDAMRYGSETEPVACDIFETALFFLTGGHVRVEHRGLMLACPELSRKLPEGEWKDAEEGRRSRPVGEPLARPAGRRRPPDCPSSESEGQSASTYEGWCGTSPDGIVHFSGPYARDPSLLEIKCPSVNRRTFYSDRGGNDRFGIPHYYFDQIQGIMGLQHLRDALFVVHLPDRTQVAHYLFQPAYFEALLRGLREFWFGRYLPAAVACAQGRLRVGKIHPEDASLLLIDEDPANEAMRWLAEDARPPDGMEILLREAEPGTGGEEDGGLPGTGGDDAGQ
jgi:hypothetical protein